MRMLLAPDRRSKLNAVTDGPKEALMNERAFDAQLFGCNEISHTDDTS